MQCPSCAKEIPDASTFCLHCGKSTIQQKKTSIGEKATWLIIGSLLACLAFLLIFKFSQPRYEQLPSKSEPRIAPSTPTTVPVMVPYTQKLLSGQLVVKAGGYVQDRIIIDAEKMHNVRLTGSFTASGGTGNDVQAVIAEESEYTNWINGHPAHVLYSTGKETTGKFDVSINQSGIYYLAFSNKFSPLTDKEVFADCQISYMVATEQH